MANDRDQVTQFWHNLEIELSEPVLIYSVGRCFDLPDRDRMVMWGIFFLTPSAFFFMHFAQANWFSIIMNQSQRFNCHKLTLRVSRSCLIGIRQEERAGLWSRLWRREMPPITIEYLDEEGRSRSLRFTLEKDRENFLSLLDTRNLFRR
ncbi:MAG TPA: hypothetical protein VMW87_04705 [Spirochaetia bacterium]|nr:hypothetical protein [Spirochaetia bacterium]